MREGKALPDRVKVACDLEQKCQRLLLWLFFRLGQVCWWVRGKLRMNKVLSNEKTGTLTDGKGEQGQIENRRLARYYAW